MDELKNQPCPVCGKNTLTLSQEDYNIPHFGEALVFSMHCDSCKYHKADIETLDVHDPAKYEFMIESVEDLNVKVIKSANATVKLPNARLSSEPGSGSDGYISNIEGLINRFEKIIQDQRDHSDDKSARKSAKNLLKKLWKVKLGEIPFKVIIEDPTGNSAIVSEKVKITKLKVKK
jgi:zinc finger protein